MKTSVLGSVQFTMAIFPYQVFINKNENENEPFCHKLKQKTSSHKLYCAKNFFVSVCDKKVHFRIVSQFHGSAFALFSSGGGGMSTFVLIAELVGPRHRSLMGTSLWYCWTLSLIALAGVAYLVRNWRTLCIVTGAPAIAVAGLWL